jgi:hypothetical protein
LNFTATLQAAAVELNKVNLAYGAVKSMSMTIEYNLFSSYTATTAHESSKGKFIRQNANYYSELLGITTVQNAKHKITINTQEKSLLLSNPDKTPPAPSPVLLDSILRVCSSIDRIDLGAGKKLYQLKFAKLTYYDYERIDIHLGSNQLIEKFVLYFRSAVVLDDNDQNLKKDKPRLEISYSAIILNSEVDTNLFSEKIYVESLGSEGFKPTAAYQTYQFYNLKP